MKKIFTHILILFILIIPLFISAQGTTLTGNRDTNSNSLFDPVNGLIVCGGKKADGTNQAMCTFDDIMKQINKLVDFLFYLSIPVAVVMFVYAGFKFMSGSALGKEDDLKKGREIFFNVLKGFAIMFLSWAVVKLIFVTLIKLPKDGEFKFIDLLG